MNRVKPFRSVNWQFNSRQLLSTRKAYLLQYHYVDDMMNKRTPHRSDHLNFADKYVKSGKLIAGGAVVPAVEEGFLLFKCEDKMEVEQFAKDDPYMKANLIKHYEVKEWAVAIGEI